MALSIGGDVPLKTVLRVKSNIYVFIVPKILVEHQNMKVGGRYKVFFELIQDDK